MTSDEDWKPKVTMASSSFVPSVGSMPWRYPKSCRWSYRLLSTIVNFAISFQVEKLQCKWKLTRCVDHCVLYLPGTICSVCSVWRFLECSFAGDFAVPQQAQVPAKEDKIWTQQKIGYCVRLRQMLLWAWRSESLGDCLKNVIIAYCHAYCKILQIHVLHYFRVLNLSQVSSEREKEVNSLLSRPVVYEKVEGRSKSPRIHKTTFGACDVSFQYRAWWFPKEPCAITKC